MSPTGIQDDFDIFALQSFADFEGLTEHVDLAVERDLADEAAKHFFEGLNRQT